MDWVIEEIRRELNEKADPAIRESSKRFFKEEPKCYGMKTADVVRMAKKHWKEIKEKDKPEIYELCEELYRSGYMEESFIVSEWAKYMSERFEKDDIYVFKRWIDSYITNWASCDGFCNHAVGDFIKKYPEYIEELKNWTQSDNRWMRRAAAVSLIIPAKKGEFLKESIEIANLLFSDSEDMVQKGYGWLLKEQSRVHMQEIFEYIMKNKKNMPRTSLRYAIELMPKDMRAEAMKKDWKKKFT